MKKTETRRRKVVQKLVQSHPTSKWQACCWSLGWSPKPLSLHSHTEMPASQEEKQRQPFLGCPFSPGQRQRWLSQPGQGTILCSLAWPHPRGTADVGGSTYRVAGCQFVGVWPSPWGRYPRPSWLLRPQGSSQVSLGASRFPSFHCCSSGLDAFSCP